MNDDKNCDYDGFVNALWGPIALVGFIVHPILSFAILLLWAWSVSTSASKPTRAPPEQKAEREAAWLRQDAEQHRRWVENQKVWARAVEAEAKLKQYAP